MNDASHESPDRLLIVFGDQLDSRSAALKAIDKQRDVVLMMEVAQEATNVPSHKQRIVLFLSAMRHHAEALRRRGCRVRYVKLDDPDNTQSLDGEIERAIGELRPRVVTAVRPGAWRVLRLVERRVAQPGPNLELLEDDHFYVDPDEFAAWAAGRKELVLEHFYRMMRKRLGVLVDAEGKPEGGVWNYDKDNRRPFREDRVAIPPRTGFRPDAITREVIELVERRFPDAPGRVDGFAWPVTRRQARRALRSFIDERLARFGPHQDAMVGSEPWMFHSLLSPALNLKLLDPRECVSAALDAYRQGRAPLNSVEGFVRQLIGWREFIRGVYWLAGPGYADGNALRQHGSLPPLYWTGETDLECLRECVLQVLDHGFGHHIQRLMVTGNFALIAGVDPRAVSDWYLAMYVDAVDWVTLPNTLGMAMHADGGLVGTKPYAAGGRYINRMSDYCASCRYDPKQRHGADACPFSTFYWDFLLRNADRLRGNQRMGLALKNLDGIDAGERRRITTRAGKLRSSLGIETKGKARA
ncbi:MAG: cryptochrome/photolyase family protein [Planctomycetota bacterium]|jgi:deoxyribodipyrimidine photolyase-related protein